MDATRVNKHGEFVAKVNHNRMEFDNLLSPRSNESHEEM